MAVDRSAYNTPGQTIYDEPRYWLVVVEFEGERYERRAFTQSKWAAGADVQAMFPEGLITSVELEGS